jgi:hypothetical protein
MALLAAHRLVERAGADLRAAKTAEGFEVVVDADVGETLPIGGFLRDDRVESGGKLCKVLGARLGKIWAVAEEEGVAVGFEPQELAIVGREGKVVKQMLAMDGTMQVVEVDKNGGGLVYFDLYGVGWYIGKIGRRFVYSFVCAHDRILVLASKLPFAREEAGEAEDHFTTVGFEEISLKQSIAATEPTGFFIFDRVKWGNEYGTVVGVNGMTVGVRSDAQMIECGYIEMIESEKLTLIGRISREGVRTWNSVKYSVNSDDFAGTKFLPGARIESEGGKRGVVIGVLDRVIWAVLDGEVEPIPVNDRTKLIASYMDVNATETYGGFIVNVSLMHCCLRHMKPGDKRKAKGEKIVWYLGYLPDDELWFQDVDSLEYRKIALRDLDPEFYEPDRFSV